MKYFFYDLSWITAPDYSFTRMNVQFMPDTSCLKTRLRELTTKTRLRELTSLVTVCYLFLVSSLSSKIVM